MKEKNQKITNPIIENLTRYMKEKNTTQKQLAKVLNVDPSTVSKWMNERADMPLDSIIKVADHFGLTVNDFIYTLAEREKIVDFKDNAHKPIIAQKMVDMLLIDKAFKQSKSIISVSIIMYSFLGLMTKGLLHNSEYFGLIIILGIFMVLKAFKNHFYIDKTYIISYLDDIYYTRDDVNNPHFIYSIIVRVVSLFSIAYYITIFQWIEVVDKEVTGLFVGLTFGLMILLFSLIMSLAIIKRNFKKNIYDDEIDGFKNASLFLQIHCMISTYFVLLTIYDFNKFWIMLLVSIVFLVLAYVDFHFSSKDHSKYYLVYEEKDKDPQLLKNQT